MKRYKTEPITLAHKEIINGIRERYSHKLASHSFVSLFLWKEELGLSVYVEDEGYVVKASSYGENIYFFPCGSEAMKKNFIQYALINWIDFIYVSDSDKEFLEKNFPGRYRFKEVPKSHEYVYSREEYRLLAGKEFAKIRNLINSINKNYDVRIEDITDENISVAKSVFEKYTTSINGEVDGFSEMVSEEMIFEYRKELGIYGIIIYLNNHPEAVSFNYKLTNNIVDGCLEAHNHSISGLFCFVLHNSLFYSGDGIEFLNAEEDLGIEGLRNIKRNMRPKYLNYIWKANINHE